MDSSDSDFDTLDESSSLCSPNIEPKNDSQVAERSYLRGIVDMGRLVAFCFDIGYGQVAY